MNLSWTSAGTWLLHCALGGGLILLVTVCLMCLTRQPARRQRLGEFGLASALVVAVLSLVGPTWLVVPWPAAPEEKLVKAEPTATPQPDAGGEDGPDWMLVDFEGGVADTTAAAPAAHVARDSDPVASTFWSWHTFGQALLAGFAVVACFFLLRWMVGLYALARMLGKAGPAPRAISVLFAEMARQRWRARLLMSRRLRVPVSCGLVRPTVLVPHALCAPADFPKLRWVFAHELTHIERRDAWSCWLMGLGQALFFFVPWFWWIKRQVRLCQEYVADAAAVAAVNESAPAGTLADYAEFLLSLTQAPAPPLAATGVSGNKSDLYRRVSMLLESSVPVQRRCPRSWACFAAVGLLALAVLVGGVGVQAEAAQKITIIIESEPGKKTEPEVKVIRIPVEPAKTITAADKKIHVEKGILIRKVGPDGKIIIEERHDSNKPAEPKAAPPKRVLKLLFDPDGKMQNLDEIFKNLGGKHAEFHLQLDPKQKPSDKGFEIELHLAPKDLPAKKLDFKVPFERKLGVNPKQLKEVEENLQKVLEELKKNSNVPEDARKALEKGILHIRQAQDQAKKAPGVAPNPPVLTPMRKDGPVLFQPPFALGLKLETPAAALADQLSLPKGQGLVVTDAKADTPAAKAGFKVNDILIKINDQAVASDPAAVNKLLPKGIAFSPDGKKLAASFDAVVLRKGKEVTLKDVTLASEHGFGIRYGQFRDGQGGLAAWPAKLADNQIMITTSRGEKGFTTRYQEGSLAITVTGKVEDGKARVGEIHVRDGDSNETYRSVDQVPARYRDKVNHAIQLSTFGSSPNQSK
jgi:beta-lactamase regulating signal transducer with metallopeptidase domain